MTWLDWLIEELEATESTLSEHLENVRLRLDDLQRPVIDGLTSRDPNIVSGSLCIEGTRIPVTVILSTHQSGWDTERIIGDGWPQLSAETIGRVIQEYGQ